MTSMFKRQDPTKLQQQVAALKGSGGFQKDEKEWKLTVDNEKNGTAVIRFLPERSDDELAFVRLVSHSFQKNSKWFIQNCPSTHGDYDGCPLCRHISENDLYEKAKVKGSEADKLLGMISRKNSFWANILVVKDPANPANEGKVFKYRFGKSIMDKITLAITGNPELDEPGIAVTCPFGGANFTVKSKKKSGFANYDDSTFGAAKPIDNIDSEERQKEIFEGMSDLRPIIAKDQFKSDEELTKQFNAIMGGALLGATASAAASLDDELKGFDDELKQFDNGASKGAVESGGVSNLTVGAGDALPDDDKVTGGSVPDAGDVGNDEDLDALLNDL